MIPYPQLKNRNCKGGFVRRLKLSLLGILISLTISLILFAASGTPAAPQASQAASGGDVDGLQRSYRLDTYQLLAKEGPQRGRNIYKYKCWVCHEQYQKDAPDLKGLFSHASLLTGKPVNVRHP